MTISETNVREVLARIIEPDLKKDIVALELVHDIKITDGGITLRVEVSNPAMHSRKRMEEAVTFNLQQAFGKELKVNAQIVAMSGAKAKARKILPGVKHVVAIASGKGGVGKSTITANLAVALAKRGLKVGLVDADIYGPSMPMMFDVAQEKPRTKEVDGKNLIVPVRSHDVDLLSIGFFADPAQAIAWRGPMASKALEQMFKDTLWGDLDIMLIDLPPGTGDIHLSLVQAVPLTGAIIVTTPQPIALADARKGVGLFKLPSVDVMVLGLVENMAWFTPEELPKSRYYIFGKDGGKALAEELKVPFLGQVPLVQSIREAGDVGRPAVMQEQTVVAKAFEAIAADLWKALGERSLQSANA